MSKFKNLWLQPFKQRPWWFQERLDLDHDGFLSTGELRELPGMQGISLEVRPSENYFIGNSGYNNS
jgi:hypothetical protein